MRLPSGPGEAAADGANALNDATSACRAVSTLSAEVAVSGSINGQRLRGRLLVGAASPASARIEAVAPFGQPLFIFVSRGEDATLLLPRDNRALEHGPSASVLEAVAGVPLDGADLRVALTGCASMAADATRARQVGAEWRIVPDRQDDIYLRREGASGKWQVVAALHRRSTTAPPGADEWRAEYANVQNGLPRTVRFRSADGKRFDLQLSLSQVDVNTPLGADVFEVQIPRGADPISLDELRRTRLGAREN
jgi:outer membrane lipoprotein-sorting protein